MNDIVLLRKKYFELLHHFSQISCKIDFLPISKSEFMLLKLIQSFHEKGKKVMVRDVAEMLKVTSPAISRMIRGLSDKGYVVKKELPEDRRNTYLIVTESGNEMMEQCDARLCRISDAIFEKYEYDKAWEFAKECNKILSLFEEAINQERHRGDTE